jgi:hypothetical protein
MLSKTAIAGQAKNDEEAERMFHLTLPRKFRA